MTNSFTPGPWVLDGLHVRTSDYHSIALVGDVFEKCPSEANARLIACAPELFDLAIAVFTGNTEYDALEKMAADLVEKITKGTVNPPDEIVFQGYSRAQLDEAFKKVANPKDWRDEILAQVKAIDVEITVAAIRFFTATEPIVTYPYPYTRYFVHSVGYRAGPAGL